MKKEELNSNIPMGRGMIKWAPFATMPEQFESVQNIIHSQDKIKRPILTDDRVDLMSRKMSYALHHKLPVKIEYYYDGFRYSVDVEIIKIDQWSEVLIGRYIDSLDSFFIPFIDILEISLL
ncbi:YolD-like family protein [Phocicoccus pinnipedialis]|uniref:YolD-like protein n=2 Tax=Phocicoccus pinnipedialis TaxID=110845 RepID=A0A6V7RAJ1_9BACL|nr:YolD-like protein [Jeotgalicoccus pinnipedialis]